MAWVGGATSSMACPSGVNEDITRRNVTGPIAGDAARARYSRWIVEVVSVSADDKRL